MTNLVSVVVTCYNHEAYITQCLESIFAQTYGHIELIVLNDGSTDHSGMIIEDTLSRSPFERTTMYYQENQGVVATRNQGLTKVSGDFLLFVDSDNYLEKDYIEKLVSRAQEQEADIVYTALRDSDTGQNLIDNQEFSLEKFYQGNLIDMCSLIRRSIIGETSFDRTLNELGVEDYDFFFSLIVEKSARVTFCPETFLNYRVLNTSRSSRGNLKKYYEAYSYILGKYAPYHWDLAKKAISQHMNSLARLDIEHSIKEDSISIWSTDVLLTERPILVEDRFSIILPEGISELTIKPSQIPSFFDYFEVADGQSNLPLSAQLANGFLLNSKAIFPDGHAFITYPVSADIKEVVISYRRYNISNIAASDYIGKLLAKDLFETAQKQRELQEELTRLKASKAYRFARMLEFIVRPLKKITRR